MRRHRKNAHGFSLVEVVIALGLFSFCIVAITGLFSVGLRSTRSVANESLAANIAASVYGGWEIQRSADADLVIPEILTNKRISVSGSNEYFFDGRGVQLANSNLAAIKMLSLVQAAKEGTNVTSTVALTFSWPVSGATNAVQTRSYSRVFVK
jgi:uncharacterized protein (TIGR02598 family)